MTVFLEKLRKVVQECPSNLGRWINGGTAFEVTSPAFSIYLSRFFKGTLKTFVRQLHFYGFNKAEQQDGAWTFSHPKFLENSPELMFDIKRKTKFRTVQGLVPKSEVDQLKREITSFKNSMIEEVNSLRTQLHLLLNSLSPEIQSLPVVHKTKRPHSPGHNSLLFEEIGADGPRFVDFVSTLALDDGSQPHYSTATPASMPLRPTSMYQSPKKRVKMLHAHSTSGYAASPDFMVNGFILPVQDININYADHSPPGMFYRN